MEGKTVKISAILITIFLLFYYAIPTKLPLPPKPPADYPSVLIIESLDIEAPILFSKTRDEEKVQELLQRGVVHFWRTAMPGTVGNVYILGHSSDFWHVPGDYKRVFERLPEIQIGERIEIRHKGEAFEYMVLKTMVVDPSDTWVLDQETENRKLLSLQTSYPVGSADKRFIVVAEQVEK